MPLSRVTKVKSLEISEGYVNVLSNDHTYILSLHHDVFHPSAHLTRQTPEIKSQVALFAQCPHSREQLYPYFPATHSEIIQF